MENTEERAACASNAKKSSVRSGGKMTWDVTVIDKLVYLVNSIVLLVCGVVLLFTIKPLDAPHKSISCVMPDQFSSSMVAWGHQQCLSSSANLSSPFLLRHFNDSLITQDEIYHPRQPNSDFSSSLLLMAILSLLPILCWRLVGSIDGRDFLTRGDGSTANGLIVVLWFLITKVGTFVLCIFFAVMITVMKGQGEEYLDVAEYNRKPENFPVRCSFMVEKPGEKARQYIVACLISKGQNDVPLLLDLMLSFGYILGSVLQSLQIWLISLLIFHVFNLVSAIIIIFSFSGKPSRISFIQKYVPEGTDTAACDKIDHRLGYTGAVVFNLAVRLGHGGLVKDALTEFCSQQD